MKYLHILILLFLCSCSAQKRLNRIIANHPELAHADTVAIPFHKDAVIIDTVIKNKNLDDYGYIFAEIDSLLPKVKDSVINTEVKKAVLSDSKKKISGLDHTRKTVIHKGGITTTIDEYGDDSFGVNVFSAATDTVFKAPVKTFQIQKPSFNYWKMAWILFALLILLVLLYGVYRKVRG